MRIYIISRGYPSKKYVMNGIFEFDQAKALARKGHEVVFLALDLRSLRRKRTWGFESLNIDNVKIEAANIPCGKLSKTVLRDVRSIALKKLFKQCMDKYGKPDIIHAHFQEIGYTTAHVLDDTGIPMVLTEHLSKLNNEVLDSDILKTGKATYHYFDKVISVGETLQRSLNNNFNIKSQVVPNIVDISSFDYELVKTQRNNKEFRIISVGSLIKRKQMDLLIDAFVEFQKSHTNSYLDIFGEGPEREFLQKKIQEYDLEKYVTLRGLCERKIIATQMAVSDCFALASDVETFGVVYIEAMAMGLPVVAVKSGGPETFVADFNGILVEPHNVNALKKAICDMYEKIDCYDRNEICKYVWDKFSPLAIAGQLEMVYQEVINQNGGHYG